MISKKRAEIAVLRDLREQEGGISFDVAVARFFGLVYDRYMANPHDQRDMAIRQQDATCVLESNPKMRRRYLSVRRGSRNLYRYAILDMWTGNLYHYSQYPNKVWWSGAAWVPPGTIRPLGNIWDETLEEVWFK